MSDEEPKCTSEIGEKSLDQLPPTSRQRYETSYDKFMEWRSIRKSESFSENVFLLYFQELSEKFKSSTLWSIYSMLRNITNIKHDVDISKYLKLRAFLKRKSENYVPKKSKIITPEEFNKFLNSAPDQIYLLIKAVVVVGLAGACRREELCQLRVDDMEDLNSAMLIKLKNSKNNTLRSFAVTGHFYDICKKYADLRPPLCPEKRFFLNYKNGRCTRHVVGVNKIGGMARDVATYLKLPNPEQYTGHSFRRSSATMLVNAGGDFLSRKRSINEAEDHTDQIETYDLIVKSETPTDENSKEPLEELPEIGESSNGTTFSLTENVFNKNENPGLHFQNCSNITISCNKIVKPETFTDENTRDPLEEEPEIMQSSNSTNISLPEYMFNKETPGIHLQNCSNITIHYHFK